MRLPARHLTCGCQPVSICKLHRTPPLQASGCYRVGRVLGCTWGDFKHLLEAEEALIHAAIFPDTF